MLITLGRASSARAWLPRVLVREFFGPSDRDQFLVYVEMQAGSRIQATDDVTRRISQWLEDRETNPEVTSHIAYVGTGGPRFFLSLSPLDPDPNVAFLVVNTETGNRVPAVIAQDGVSAFSRTRCLKLPRA